MKNKVEKIIRAAIMIFIGWQLGLWIIHINKMRQLEELNAKVELLYKYSQYELNDIEIQKQ